MYSIVHVQNRTRWRWRDRLFLNCRRTKFIIFHFNLFGFALLPSPREGPSLVIFDADEGGAHELSHRRASPFPAHTFIDRQCTITPHTYAQCQGPRKFTCDFCVNFCFCAKVLTRHFSVKVLRGTQSEGRYRASFSLSYCLESFLLLRCACKCNKGEDNNKKPL